MLEKWLCIGTAMSPDMKVTLTEFLRDNTNVFMWKPL